MSGMASGFSVQQMKLRAFDLSERTTRLGRRSVQQRLSRLRSRGFLISQTAVTAVHHLITAGQSLCPSLSVS